MPILKPEQRPTFTATYNCSSFAFDHSLHELDLFDLDQLRALASRLPDPAYHSTAKSTIGDGWKRLGDHRPSLDATLATLAETNSLVLLKHCEKDRQCGELFRELMREVVEHAGDVLGADLDVGRTTIVISSPRRVTSYHIDAEVNFLLQVRGHKLLHVFDPNDRTILSEAELEAFYSGDFDGARYRAERESDARVYQLEPGRGVHMPLHAPHWAQNLDDVSVGVSLNFNLRSGARLAKLYKMNNRLRKAGIAPTAPGISPWRDRVKLAAFASVESARTLLHSRRQKATFN
ncbi:MAG TPA: cupin-like domain-containing protein [Candidatus Aquilonibacter sp.]